MNVIVHCDPAQESDPRQLVLGRKILIHTLNASLRESLLHEDTTRFFVVGSQDPDFLGRGSGAKYVKDTEKPAEAAEAVANIARSGLTLVLSTFRNLPLEQVNGARYPATIGIKANHIWDRELGLDTGTWDTGEPELPVVNTKPGFGGKIPKDLERYRFIQVARHEQTIERLEAANVKMATAVFDRTKAHDFAVAGTDASIAKAIKRAGRR
jgi:hypothetical protein